MTSYHVFSSIRNPCSPNLDPENRDDALVTTSYAAPVAGAPRRGSCRCRTPSWPSAITFKIYGDGKGFAVFLSRVFGRSLSNPPFLSSLSGDSKHHALAPDCSLRASTRRSTFSPFHWAFSSSLPFVFLLSLVSLFVEQTCRWRLSSRKPIRTSFASCVAAIGSIFRNYSPFTCR